MKIESDHDKLNGELYYQLYSRLGTFYLRVPMPGWLHRSIARKAWREVSS